MPARSYLDTLFDSELETVVPWLSRFPYRSKWEDPFSDYDLWCLVGRDNPFQRHCAELLGARVLPANLVVAIAHIATHCYFEDWNFGELLREWSMEVFAKLCVPLKSISFDSLSSSSKAAETGYEHLMGTVGARLTTLSLRHPPKWMWMPIQYACLNLRKLHIACKSADATRPSFWSRVGRGLEELQIELQFESKRGLNREKTNMRRMTKSIKLHCRGLKCLTLNGIREGCAIMAACLKSFRSLEETELGARFWDLDAMQLVADSCKNIRVRLTFGNPDVTPFSEVEVASVLHSFGGRVEELELIDNLWFKTLDYAADFERALNECANVKKFTTRSPESTRMMFAQPKLDLREVSSTAQLTSQHIAALARSTRALRKLCLLYVCPDIPVWMWKDVMNANRRTLEEMYISTSHPPDMHRTSIRQMNSFTNGMVDKLAYLLRAMADLPELYIAHLHVRGFSMGEAEKTRFRDACVRLRRRRIRVAVNGAVLLPVGCPTGVY